MAYTQITDIFPHKKRISRVPVSHAVIKTGVNDSSPTSTSTSLQVKKDIELLKLFDLNWEYGPCTGITRMERWNRALKLGLNPPKIVKDIIEQHSKEKNYTQSLWYGYEI